MEHVWIVRFDFIDAHGGDSAAARRAGRMVDEKLEELEAIGQDEIPEQLIVSRLEFGVETLQGRIDRLRKIGEPVEALIVERGELVAKIAATREANRERKGKRVRVIEAAGKLKARAFSLTDDALEALCNRLARQTRKLLEGKADSYTCFPKEIPAEVAQNYAAFDQARRLMGRLCKERFFEGLPEPLARAAATVCTSVS